MPWVLIVDDDPVLVALLAETLTDEGYQVKVLLDTNPTVVQSVVEHDLPSCVVLDGSGYSDYGEAWETAAWLQQRTSPVPTIMLTGHRASAAEARARATPRSQAAGIVAILEKPFEITDLIAAVGQAVRGRH
jgi:CheY-like chemotaxis protein